jgi:hypothetical protein
VEKAAEKTKSGSALPAAGARSPKRTALPAKPTSTADERVAAPTVQVARSGRELALGAGALLALVVASGSLVLAARRAGPWTTRP